MTSKPIIAITMGDGAGVGPEIVVKALDRLDDPPFRPLIIGDLHLLRRAAHVCGITERLHAVPDAQTVPPPGTVAVIDLDLLPAELPVGQVSREAGHAAYHYIRTAVDLAMTETVDAICTAPLNKEALHLAGHRYPGHTEILAALTEVPEVSMMLACPTLRVIHVTTHVGLLDAVELIEPGLVYRTIRRGHDMLTGAGVASPFIAVCGINPHAGENGLFGRGEEGDKIEPALERARQDGIDVAGPLPADTIFFRAGRGDFDLVVAMYHDQGHGPVKILGLDGGVNITVGLPVVRTSVDHGTAFDIAGQGSVDERSMIEALRQAAALAPRHSRGTQ